MIHLIQRNGNFYFNRRIPNAYRQLDKRGLIRFSLKTKCLKTALRMAISESDKLDAYWETLKQTQQTHCDAKYSTLAKRARILGYPYYPIQTLIDMPVQVLIERLLHLEKVNYSEGHTEALLGKAPIPATLLSEVPNQYFEFSKDITLNKSPNQIRKWKNPRIKTMESFITCVGDKAVNTLTRQDVLKYRDWWIERIRKDNYSVDTATKNLVYAKVMICSVAENLKISIDTEHLFKKIRITGDDGKRRLPFDSKHIVETILNPEKLKGLNDQAKWVLHAFAETGAGFNELTGLQPEDIVLNAEIPHIHIRPRKGRSLKTKFRNRIIPLVGYALDAFKACPQGFTNYHDRPDSLSGAIGKYLKENNMMPTDQHTIYSLRHSFQDRLLAVNTPDRIQADLMGHKFARPRYGDGATLAHKLEWMEKIKLKE